MQKQGEKWVASRWGFIEKFGGSWRDSTMTPEDACYVREVAAAWLRLTYPPPPGCFLEVIEATYVSPFPVIAVGWDGPDSPTGGPDYFDLTEKALAELVPAVDWSRLIEARRRHSGDRLSRTQP